MDLYGNQLIDRRHPWHWRTTTKWNITI